MINNVEVKPEEYEEKYDAAWHALRQQQDNKKDKKEDEERKNRISTVIEEMERLTEE